MHYHGYIKLFYMHEYIYGNVYNYSVSDGTGVMAMVWIYSCACNMNHTSTSFPICIGCSSSALERKQKMWYVCV